MTNYTRGRQFEYKIRDELRRRGYFVIRTAGSHTCCDLVAMKASYRLFVQCRGGKRFSTDEWNDLYVQARACSAIPILATRPLLFERLTGLRRNGQRKPPKIPIEP